MPGPVADAVCKVESGPCSWSLPLVEGSTPEKVERVGRQTDGWTDGRMGRGGVEWREVARESFPSGHLASLCKVRESGIVSQRDISG